MEANAKAAVLIVIGSVNEFIGIAIKVISLPPAT